MLFRSDEAKSASQADSFAQTAAEAPVDEDVTPVEASADAAIATDAGPMGDALDSASPTKPFKRPQNDTPATPNNVLYIGNLYYEVTEDQLRRVFSRFGEVENVRIVIDNRGLSRG